MGRSRVNIVTIIVVVVVVVMVTNSISSLIKPNLRRQLCDKQLSSLHCTDRMLHYEFDVQPSSNSLLLQ